MVLRMFISAVQRIRRVYFICKLKVGVLRVFAKLCSGLTQPVKTQTPCFLMRMVTKTWICMYVVAEMNFPLIPLHSSAAYISMKARVNLPNQGRYSLLTFSKAVVV